MAKRDDILDRPLLSLSDEDYLDVRSVREGCLVKRRAGSAKAPRAASRPACAFLSTPKMGGLVLTAKAEETGTGSATQKTADEKKTSSSSMPNRVTASTRCITN